MYKDLIKSLRWLAFMFPETHPAKDDADRMSNNIHLYCKEAADAIEELQKQRDEWESHAALAESFAQGWIPVTERLPDDRRDVQITVFWHDAWRTMYGYYDGAFWHLYAPMHTEVADVEVIGWMEKPAPMPLPEPPKGETDG